MSKQKPLNVKLFNRIIRFIDKDVRRLYMPDAGIKKGSDAARAMGHLLQFAPHCGSACCFGGWSYALSVKHPKFGAYGTLCVDFNREARRLGLIESGFTFPDQNLFRETGGTQAEQWETVKGRLRRLIADRVAAGERSAAKIKVPA